MSFIENCKDALEKNRVRQTLLSSAEWGVDPFDRCELEEEIQKAENDLAELKSERDGITWAESEDAPSEEEAEEELERLFEEAGRLKRYIEEYPA